MTQRQKFRSLLDRLVRGMLEENENFDAHNYADFLVGTDYMMGKMIEEFTNSTSYLVNCEFAEKEIEKSKFRIRNGRSKG